MIMGIENLEKEAKSMAELLDWIYKSLFALAILLGAWLLWRIVRRAVRLAVERTGLDPTASNFLLTLLRAC